MRSLVILVVGTLALGGVASAQSTASAPGKGYVEGVAQASFGNVTSQSFGAEGGLTVMPGLQIFVEGGRMRDVSTTAIRADALMVASALSQTLPGVSYREKQPVTFGAAGVKLLVPLNATLQPYVMVGVGIAKVKQDVTFAVNGSDVTNTIAQYGVVLGSDLSGTFSKPLLTLGGGVAWPVWRQLMLDFQYRYGRIFADDQAINVNRAGVGIGIRF